MNNPLEPRSPDAAGFVVLRDLEGSTAWVAPEKGAWLLRYSRFFLEHGPVDALHFDWEVVERYPREMYAGSPVLFPLVSYNHLPGQEHHIAWPTGVAPMPQHGFGRRRPWRVIDRDFSAVTLELTDDDVTRAQYPFAFGHRLTYRLAGGRLTWEQEIENRAAEPMPFASGFHPYFAAPLVPRGIRSECLVEIPAGRRFDPDPDSITFQSSDWPAGPWRVANDLPGSLLLGDLEPREVHYVDPAGELEVVVNWEMAPAYRFLVLWTRTPDSPFFCVEPWTALPNVFRRAGDDCLHLAPGETLRSTFWMELRALE